GMRVAHLVEKRLLRVLLFGAEEEPDLGVAGADGVVERRHRSRVERRIPRAAAKRGIEEWTEAPRRFDLADSAARGDLIVRRDVSGPHLLPWIAVADEDHLAEVRL